jgi:tripartite-type tricarboxylate transporter receptor subunit TctC
MVYSKRRRDVLAAPLAVGVLGGAWRKSVLAQTATGALSDWPTKPLRIIVPFAPGGVSDSWARILAEILSPQLGQPVIVENKPGAGGLIGMEYLAKFGADNHTFGICTTGPLSSYKVLYRKLRYDLDRDFSVFAMLPTGPGPIAVPNDLPVKNLGEWIDLSMSKPLTVGTWGPASGPHMFCEFLNQRNRLNLQFVHYRGEAPAWADLATGQIQLASGSYLSALPHLQSNRIKVIAQSGSVRSPKFANIPTLAEQGFDDEPVFRLDGYLPAFVPSATSERIQRRLSELIVSAAEHPRLKAMFDAYAIWLRPPPYDEAVRMFRRYYEANIKYVSRFDIKLD